MLQVRPMQSVIIFESFIMALVKTGLQWVFAHKETIILPKTYFLASQYQQRIKAIKLLMILL